ncbi:MAG: Hsp20/alpha crystallin family protein [Kiloniellales bacterium]|nr:Hsp20/alpha crystallin family protein [Kiloniellales bacterium]
MTDSDTQPIEVQQKKELEGKEELTSTARHYVPYTDIYEVQDALIVVMEIPGVRKEDLDIELEDDVLSVEGRIDFSTYGEMQPVYTEYNIGHFLRKFTISSKIDQGKITAEVKDGALTLRLPKAEAAKPRTIKIS